MLQSQPPFAKVFWQISRATCLRQLHLLSEQREEQWDFTNNWVVPNVNIAEFAVFSDWKYLLLKGFKPVISWVRDHDATTVQYDTCDRQDL